MEFGGFVVTIPERQHCNCKYTLQIKMITPTCMSSFTVLHNCMCLLGRLRAGSAIHKEKQSGEKSIRSF